MGRGGVESKNDLEESGGEKGREAVCWIIQDLSKGCY